MAGGTWQSQNKARPGVYIRFRSTSPTGLVPGERGTVAIAEPLSWGPDADVMVIEAGADTTPYTGYDITAPQNRFLNEIFKGTNRTPAPKKVLLTRAGDGYANKASASLGDGVTATAKYRGTRGNDIVISVTEETDGGMTVSTMVDGTVVDRQVGVKNVSDLAPNGWVEWSGAGTLAATTGKRLTGGSNGTPDVSAYSAALTELEPYQFDVLIYDGEDQTVKDAYAAFVKRIAKESGSYTQLVSTWYDSNPDSQFVVNVTKGVTLADGTQLMPEQATWWVGGALAGARYNESLTYARYPGAVSNLSGPKDRDEDIVEALNNGHFLLVSEDGAVRIEQDINTLVTYTEENGKPFHKNRVFRLCSTIANDIYAQFSKNFIGVVNNNEAGRSRFKAVIVGYLLDLQGNQGIQNFTPDDVEVLPGNDIDAVVVNIAVTPVDSVEKIYMTVEVA